MVLYLHISGHNRSPDLTEIQWWASLQGVHQLTINRIASKNVYDYMTPDISGRIVATSQKFNPIWCLGLSCLCIKHGVNRDFWEILTARPTHRCNVRIITIFYAISMLSIVNKKYYRFVKAISIIIDRIAQILLYISSSCLRYKINRIHYIINIELI